MDMQEYIENFLAAYFFFGVPFLFYTSWKIMSQKEKEKQKNCSRIHQVPVDPKSDTEFLQNESQREREVVHKDLHFFRRSKEDSHKISDKISTTKENRRNFYEKE
jgi:amino acid permease